MKSNDPQKKSDKSITNLENQKVNTEKVQGGLKISYDHLVKERKGFAEETRYNEEKYRQPKSSKPTLERSDDVK